MSFVLHTSGKGRTLKWKGLELNDACGTKSIWRHEGIKKQLVTVYMPAIFQFSRRSLCLFLHYFSWLRLIIWHSSRPVTFYLFMMLQPNRWCVYETPNNSLGFSRHMFLRASSAQSNYNLLKLNKQKELYMAFISLSKWLWRISIHFCRFTAKWLEPYRQTNSKSRHSMITFWEPCPKWVGSKEVSKGSHVCLSKLLVLFMSLSPYWPHCK